MYIPSICSPLLMTIAAAQKKDRSREIEKETHKERGREKHLLARVE